MIKKLNRPKTGKRNALWLIAFLLMASGGLRLASGTGPALAREIDNLATVDDIMEHDFTPQKCEASPDIEKVLEALGQREMAIKKREDAFADRMAALNLAEQQIQQSLTDLEAAEKDLERVLAIADSAAEDDLNRLTAVYENMKPKEAAKVFEEMLPEFAAGFLGRMRPDAAASIMSGINAQKAYSISVILAGRNASVPKE